jgi:hypothetical protein
MKTVQWILIGSRIFALTCGLTVLSSGCGDSATVSGGPPGLSQEEVKRNEETRKAMEEAARPKKK